MPVYNAGVPSLFRPTIETLEAYAPGEQPAPNADVVKLNTNENPYPPSPRALAELTQVTAEDLRRYPHPYADAFRHAVADVLGTDASHVLAGNGSDEVLTMLMRSVTDAARGVTYPVPTYVLYRTLAEIQGAPTFEVPYEDAFTLPVEALLETRAPLTIVANPNSPSGAVASLDELATLATRCAGVLVIDEAYVEFAASDALDLTRRFDNVLVLRTLSKSHALAGLRLGYAVGDPSLLAGLAKVKDSYNVDAVAARVGTAALRDTAYTAETSRRICRTRRQLADRLEAMGFQVWPSQANFLLVRPPGGAAGQLYRYLKAEGVLVRYFDAPGLADKLRVTVGTDDQTSRLLAVVDAWLTTRT